MKRILGFLLTTLLAVQLRGESPAAGTLLESTQDRDGRIVERLAWPSTVKEYVTIHYPKNFDKRRIYSVHFWFHGTSGNPNAGITTAHDGYIGIGMSYLKRDMVPPGKYGAEHWKLCEEVRRSIQQRNQLRLNRNVVSGVSKGGWMAFYIGAKPRKNLHAIGIIAAGKDPNTHEIPDLKNTGLAVLVGTGETDPNFPQAQLALNFFQKAGASSVAYEEWLGKGHVSIPSKRVVQWLEVESRRGHPPELLTQWATESLSEEFETIIALPDPNDRYIGLRLLTSDPRFSHVSPELARKVRDSGRKNSQNPAVQKWLETFGKFQGLIRREAAFFDTRSFDIPKLTELVARYREMARNEEFPDLAARAANGYMRAAKMKTIYEAQIKARENPEFQKLTVRNAELQKIYSDAKGNPDKSVMEELKSVGARLGELRFQYSMNAFREVEWRGKVDTDGSVSELIKADNENAHPWKPYSGIGF